jgi:hypothetical protein
MNRTVDKFGDLKFRMHDEGAACFRFEIEGCLGGGGATEVDQAWRTACSVIVDRPLVVDIGRLTAIDSFGRALLRNWHSAGARFVVTSQLARTVVGSITGQSLIDPAAAKPHRWFRRHSRLLPLIALLTVLLPSAASGAVLETATAKAWADYIASAHRRMERHLQGGNAFLWVDEEPGRLAKVRSGEIVVAPVGPETPLKVPSGLIHDWVGAVFIPHVSIEQAIAEIRDYPHYKDSYQPTVVDSKTIAATRDADRFSLRLLNRSLFLKTALDADYESCFVHVDERRAYSVSQTTRVQEIDEYGAPGQHYLREGEGSGLIWKLFSIARYVERDGGVYLELEVIGLSRDIPASLRWFVEPIVRRISRGSLVTSLRQTEAAILDRAESGNRRSGSGMPVSTSTREMAGSSH